MPCVQAVAGVERRGIDAARREVGLFAGPHHAQVLAGGDAHGALLYREPGVVVLLAHVEARAQGAQHAVAGADFEGAGVAGGLDVDFPGAQ
ncbi:hypothetical protein WJ978_13800 [Achromobacter xylosoxidans]